MLAFFRVCPYSCSIASLISTSHTTRSRTKKRKSEVKRVRGKIRPIDSRFPWLSATTTTTTRLYPNVPLSLKSWSCRRFPRFKPGAPWIFPGTTTTPARGRSSQATSCQRSPLPRPSRPPLPRLRPRRPLSPPSRTRPLASRATPRPAARPRALPPSLLRTAWVSASV